jgi:cellulose synthase/poly-beta-1,6-N-acetylglucosamine synthase-like glycosyltransferase
VTGGAWTVGIVIPAQNEEATIERCIRSVLASCEASERCSEAWMVLVADRCTDRTIEIARHALGSRGEVLVSTAGSPGTARRLGVAAVIHHFRTRDPQRIWLANTDADTHVPLNWISTHLEHADANAGAVAGIVELDPLGLRSDVHELYRSTYKLAPDGTHTHVHGANLGVRADAYLDAGGWSDVPVAEDHCLWGRLLNRGWRVRSPASSVVLTSGRLQGRAQGGFADTLRRELGAHD